MVDGWPRIGLRQPGKNGRRLRTRRRRKTWGTWCGGLESGPVVFSVVNPAGDTGLGADVVVIGL